MTLPNGQGRYYGVFSKNKFDGIGVYVFPDGFKWHGYFALGIPVGIGELIPINSENFFSIGTKYSPDYVKGTYEEVCIGRTLVGGNMPVRLVCKSCKSDIDKEHKFCSNCGIPTVF